MTEDEYRADLRAKGYADPFVKTWEPELLNDWHTHDAALYLRTSEGELTLEVEGPDGIAVSTIGPGETLEVAAQARHTERAGPEGVTFLVATREAPQ